MKIQTKIFAIFSPIMFEFIQIFVFYAREIKAFLQKKFGPIIEETPDFKAVQDELEAMKKKAQSSQKRAR